MAEKKNLFGTALTLAALAAATAVVYSRRSEIRALLEQASELVHPARGTQPDSEPEEPEEKDIVIDMTEEDRAGEV